MSLPKATNKSRVRITPSHFPQGFSASGGRGGRMKTGKGESWLATAVMIKHFAKVFATIHAVAVTSKSNYVCCCCCHACWITNSFWDTTVAHGCMLCQSRHNQKITTIRNPNCRSTNCWISHLFLTLSAGVPSSNRPSQVLVPPLSCDTWAIGVRHRSQREHAYT